MEKHVSVIKLVYAKHEACEVTRHHGLVYD